jgi:hypothetical protein
VNRPIKHIGARAKMAFPVHVHIAAPRLRGDNCSKNNRFMNSQRRELYVNSSKSDPASDRASHDL